MVAEWGSPGSYHWRSLALLSCTHTVQASMGIASRNSLTGTPGDIFLSFINNFGPYGRNDVYRVRPEVDPNSFTGLFGISGVGEGNLITKSGLGAANGVGVTTNFSNPSSNQLIIADQGVGRLIYWNNPGVLTSGQEASGVVTASLSPNCCIALKVSHSTHLWVSAVDRIYAYQLPLTLGSQPVLTLTYPFYTADGNTLNSGPNGFAFAGLAPSDSDDSFVCVSKGFQQ